MTKKVLIIGDAGVGKTSLRTQFFHKTFSFSYRATIGANFLTKNIRLPTDSSTQTDKSDVADSDREGDLISLCIWDTAGQERFNSLSPTFFRGSDCAILLYDVTNPGSLQNLKTHHRDFRLYCGTRQPVIFVVGNKSDAADRQVQLSDARRLVSVELQDEGIECYEVSAKLGTSVEDLFMTVAKRLKARDERRKWMAFDVDEQEEGSGATGRMIDLQKRIKSSSRCAC